MLPAADLWGAELQQAAPEFRPGNLEAKFVAPPFTVLDTRQGYWQDRRRAWLSLGIRSELGRGNDLLSLSPAEQARARWSEAVPSSTSKGRSMADQFATSLGRGAVAVQGGTGSDLAGPIRNRFRSGDGRELVPGKGNARSDFGAYLTSDGTTSTGGADEEGQAAGGTSIFDPVLCELAYRWWAPPGGTILDPFAGGSVRGIVAAKLGHHYTGVDLSGRQLAANREQAAAILQAGEPVPTWLEGDSRQVLEGLQGSYDMVFSCPPYYDLEVYSNDPADLSAMSWHDFLSAYEVIVERAAALLAPDRFAVFVVSEVRDTEGYCRGLVPRTVHAFERVGLRLYNEAVLVNSAGSLPLRVTKYMESSRKLGRAHQNVLCFIKGRPEVRGWSYDRARPPSPQLGLGLEAVEPAAAAAQGHAGPDEPAAASEATLVPAADPGPSVAGAVYEPEDDEAEPPDETPDEAYSRLEDGRWVDTSTGELYEADEVGAVGAPVAPAGLPPEQWLARRAELWDASDPARPCWTCGAAPVGQYRDGSPRYDHTHDPEALQLFGGM